MAKNRPKVLKHSYPFFQIPPAPPKHTQNTKKGFLFLKTHNPKDYFYLMFDFCRKIWHNCNFIWFWIPYCFPLSVNHFQKFFQTTWLSLSFSNDQWPPFQCSWKNTSEIGFKTLPMAQRTQGLSSAHQSNFVRLYQVLTQIFSTKHQLQNLNQTSAFRPDLASESRPKLDFITSTKHQQQNIDQTSASDQIKSRLNLNFKILTKPCA